MPDCNMCWNDWPSLTGTPFPRIARTIQVCRNCARSMKQVIAFSRHHGLDLITGELSPGPQAGPETQVPGITEAEFMAEFATDQPGQGQQPPRSPSPKGARKAR